LHGVPEPRAAAREALERLRVADRTTVPVRSLSRGLQQRVSIARAIVRAPRVLLLDEPYNGLDEAGASALTAVLRELRDSSAAMVIVTHHVGEGLALASHAAIMTAGRFARFDACAGVDERAYATTYRELVSRNG
ncbi:MAG: ATP-binding cassette domain-containing protein, partial [Gemmatimonadaceae bacterium]